MLHVAVTTAGKSVCCLLNKQVLSLDFKIDRYSLMRSDCTFIRFTGFLFC